MSYADISVWYMYVETTHPAVPGIAPCRRFAVFARVKLHFFPAGSGLSHKSPTKNRVPQFFWGAGSRSPITDLAPGPRRGMSIPYAYPGRGGHEDRPDPDMGASPPARQGEISSDSSRPSGTSWPGTDTHRTALIHPRMVSSGPILSIIHVAAWGCSPSHDRMSSGSDLRTTPVGPTTRPFMVASIYCPRRRTSHVWDRSTGSPFCRGPISSRPPQSSPYIWVGTEITCDAAKNPYGPPGKNS